MNISLGRYVHGRLLPIAARIRAAFPKRCSLCRMCGLPALARGLLARGVLRWQAGGWAAGRCWLRPMRTKFPFAPRTIRQQVARAGATTASFSSLAPPGSRAERSKSSGACGSQRAFIKGNIAPGSTAKNDGPSSYLGAPAVTHEPHAAGPMAAHIVMPAIHRGFSNLKAGGGLGDPTPRST